MGSDAIIRIRDADHCAAVWDQTVVMIWRGAPTASRLAGMDALCREMIAAAKQPVTYLAVIEPTSPAPEGPARDEFARWSRDVIPQLAAAVFVAEGGGFRAALVRGVGVAVTNLMRQRFPFKIVATVDEGAALLAPKLPLAAGGAAGLVRAVGQLRQRLDG